MPPWRGARDLSYPVGRDEAGVVACRGRLFSGSMLLDFEVTSHLLPGDHPLHYHEAGPGGEASPGSGEALVLLHGSGPGVSGWSNFRGNFPVLSEHFRTLL